MKEDKKIVDFPCKTCAHAAVCIHRSDLALLADYLETPVKSYISKDTFPNGIVTMNVGCKFYSPSYMSCAPSNCSLWFDQPTCH